MVLVEAENGDTWELDEEWLPMLFEQSSIQLPVNNKEVLDELVSYARERQSLTSQAAVPSGDSEVTFNEEFVKRYKNWTLETIAHVASGARMMTFSALHKAIYEDRLRLMMQEGTSQIQAKAELDLLM